MDQVEQLNAEGKFSGWETRIYTVDQTFKHGQVLSIAPSHHSKTRVNAEIVSISAKQVMLRYTSVRGLVKQKAYRLAEFAYLFFDDETSTYEVIPTRYARDCV
jgi:hypothetical protein